MEEEEEEEGKWADGRRRGEEEKVLPHSRYYVQLPFRTEGKSKALCAGGNRPLGVAALPTSFASTPAGMSLNPCLPLRRKEPPYAQRR